MPENSAKVRHRIYLMQLAAYVGIVVVAVVGFLRLEQTSSDLCAGATENRKALRSLVVGVGNLGENLIIGDARPSDYINPQQSAALARIDAFEEEQLKTLELPICER